MAGAAYDPNHVLRVHVVSQSPHTFAYKLWIAHQGDTTWTLLDSGNIESPPKDYGPYPAGTRLAYTLLVAGNPHTDWKVAVMLSQAGAVLACSPAAATGVTSAKGVARHDAAVTLG